ncbi:RNA polymerase sigma factor SigJ [Bailinhaonella thermotolerans]|uniref:Sigma-70 family RNA polymerase sigma factor n=1 Tax=Bailinhaonella thermotolerans TaxID=1070861 RepID=A0A3A4A3L7_9ACTN|nr:RNA polymerase sigma factor SigJ [Bailinhaonella thermotolerans]RJL23045.1 sigma-70 family RNA polymerase sigma factor [Bailinhaonella thermotolerans]
MTTTSTPSAGRTDPGPGERRHLINVAYRLLGSLADAEDVVQETYARWYAMPRERREEIESPGAWLTTVAGRICLDLLRSARVRRESYVGEWLPEPVPGRAEWTGGSGGGGTDPAEHVTLDESVTMAFLVVLDSMTPAERVAFVLHDVFGYSFAEVAGIAGRTPAACRQLASSARRRVRAARASAAPEARQAEVVRDFRRAWEAKDIAALVGILDPRATLIADGGGLAQAALRPIEGGERIAGYILALMARAPGLEITECAVNGRPGLVGRNGGVVETVASFEITGDRITRIWAMRNPAKLRSWTAEPPD